MDGPNSPLWLLGWIFWILALAQLVYLPIWACKQGRSGAVWFMFALLLGGGFAMSGWMLQLSMVGYILPWMAIVAGFVALLPSFILFIAGPTKDARISRNCRRPGRMNRRRRLQLKAWVSA